MDVERFDLLGFGVTLLPSAPDAAFSVQEWRAPQRAGGIPVHPHERTEEGFYVADGEIALWLDGEALVHGPAEIIDTVHARRAPMIPVSPSLRL